MQHIPTVSTHSFSTAQPTVPHNDLNQLQAQPVPERTAHHSVLQHLLSFDALLQLNILYAPALLTHILSEK
ncbi:hypothetical protein CgunFtcFv8_006705 [Champsocephalus gunnari]|uniref:Uncharacterized protein n=1 Tax=Champsocephalus gunnari TaxID=52237 RepID=A0AAN8GX78_CHAGU|nr:hypothetical protein CgunFtcFv8_006705 [Champsocephalus gunnari]